MRFEVAVAAVLAAEKLFSSGVAAEKSLSEERAKLRNEAIEAVKDKFPHEIRRELQKRRPRRKLFQDQLLRNENLRELRGAAQQHRQRLQRKTRNLKSEDLDLGILGAKTSTKEERKTKLLSSIQNLQSHKETLLNLNRRSSSSSSSQSTIPDLGILKNNDETQKIFNALNPDKVESSSSSLLDLGIFAKENEREGKTEVEKGNRRLQFDQVALAANPLTYMVNNQLCPEGIHPNCDSCALGYNTEGVPTDGYSFSLDCDIPEGTDTYVAFEAVRDNFIMLCNMGFCEDGCDIAPEGFKIEMDNCASANLGGDIATLPDKLPDDSDGDLTDLVGDDLLGGMMGDLVSENPVASTFNAICTGVEGDQFCTTCEVTYLDEIGDIKPYDIVMDCPNVPDSLEAEDNDGFAEVGNVCSQGLCESCEVDEGALKFELRNCSWNFAFDNILEDALEDALDEVDDDFMADFISDIISDAISDSTGPYYDDDGDGDGDGDGEYLDSLPVVSPLELREEFTTYFAEICNSDDTVCEKCGPTSEDSEDSFSFEFDCPALLSSPDVGFGAYVGAAASICYLQPFLGLNCSTCEVDFFDSTINIKDCRTIPYAEDDDKGFDSYDGSLIPSDENTFALSYIQYCTDITSDLLNDEDGKKCDCTFDRATKTASVTCQFYQSCRQFDSYCGPITMCYNSDFGSSYSLSLTQSSMVSMQRCFSASFGSSDDYKFNYCINFGVTDDVVNEIAPKKVDCELEVQGIRCNSCSVDTSLAEYYDIDPSSVFLGPLSPITYNCTNTVIGKSGNKSIQYETSMIEDTLAYYSYRSLPCSGGCDLCGDGEGQFMSKPDGEFSTEIWKDNKTDTCFAAQLEAMTLIQPLTDKECQDMKDAVREPCGCKNLNPPPQSGARSFFGKGFSTTSSIVLTIAAASVVQMLLS